MTKREFMQAAAQEAAVNLTTGDGGPFGAVIVKEGKIIGRGHNEVIKNNDPTCHAEMQAIRSACQQLGTHDLSGCTLFTSCYPCPMCLSAVIWANIKTVYYGNTADDAAAIGFRDSFIYDFIKAGCRDEAVMELYPLAREITLDAFRQYAAQPTKPQY